MHLVSRPFCTLAVGLLAELSEAGCVPASQQQTLFDQHIENASYSATTRVGSCMDDSPNPGPYCM